MSGDDGFVQRWARRKARVQSGQPEPEPLPPAVLRPPAPPLPVTPAAPSAPVALAPSTDTAPAPAPVEPPVPRPTLEDVAALTRGSDYSRFVGAGVDADVSNAAMRKLFSDPHFNVMDGLDTYIDDYGKPDPIPPSMLRQMVQAQFLGLFDDEKKATAAAASTDGAAPQAMAQSKRLDDPLPSAPVSPTRPDDDTDLRLQQDDVPGRTGAAPGAGA